MTAKSTTARVAALRKRRAAAGLVRVELWLTPDEALQVRALAARLAQERSFTVNAACEHRWMTVKEGVTYCDSRCEKCGETRRDTWD